MASLVEETEAEVERAMAATKVVVMVMRQLVAASAALAVVIVDVETVEVKEVVRNLGPDLDSTNQSPWSCSWVRARNDKAGQS